MNTWIIVTIISIIIIVCVHIECEDAIDMKLNEVYGITSGSVTSANDINTMPNEVYGIAMVHDIVSGDHSTGVSSCQRWL